MEHKGKKLTTASLLATVTLLAAIFMVSCENPLYDGIITDLKDPVFYTVTFDARGGSAIPPQTILSGNHAVRPTNPIRSEYSFMDWYTESSCDNVYDFSSKISGNITLYARWQYGTTTAPTVEIAGSSSIKITWAPPTNASYAMIYRYSDKTSTYELLGKVTAADGASYLPEQCSFYDYFSDSDYSYSYYVKHQRYDVASADWVSLVSLDSETVRGRSSNGMLTVNDSYTVSYDEYYGILSFDPEVKTYPNHAQAGMFTNYMILGDGTTENLTPSTKSFSWANLTKLFYASNFKTDGIPLSVKLSCAYIKSDSATNLKSITYIDMSGTTLSGKTSDIFIPSYETHSVFFDANGGSGSMGMAHARDGISTALPANEFYRPGYSFAGWSTDPSATSANYADCAYVSGGPDDLTLYAVWKDGLTIKFDRDTAYYNAVKHYSGLSASGSPYQISGKLDNPPLTVIVSGVSGTDVPEISWRSSDTDTVRIGDCWKLDDPTTYHYLDVLSTGTVTITASLPNGSEASCTLVLRSTNSFGAATCVERPAATYPSINLEISTAN